MLLLMVIVSTLLTSVLPLALMRSRRGLVVLVGIVGPVVGAVIYAALVLATDPAPSMPQSFATASEDPNGPIHGFLGFL
jgi:uncharacterized membrane protein YeaQ/YmgE (transglycosylase-associated protein family)